MSVLLVGLSCHVLGLSRYLFLTQFSTGSAGLRHDVDVVYPVLPAHRRGGLQSADHQPQGAPGRLGHVAHALHHLRGDRLVPLPAAGEHRVGITKIL